ncbi:hypothetical protein R1T16_17400 [Flavobacterium sp. DG1-102-2]|uniref:hypothetical protein n=1 Tax=Flavobacterium sp. DG1-102-2 TaxID=3081663 RepID=UPI0029494A4D|nr:hypothetical protein [Flavobacterium sp. DG1-102-2]MDV6170216.1 hypothetical protein [Flavobacterium sp. DG1-102-2]
MDNYKRFSKIEFINNNRDKPHYEILNQCQGELAWSHSIQYTHKYFKDDQEYIKEYFKFIGHLNFFLMNGVKPLGMDNFDFLSTISITKELIKKGNFNESILELYK